MKLSIAATLLSFFAHSVAADEVIGLHGSGTTNPSKCYWHLMDLIQTQTKVPVKMTYRGIGSSTGQAEFIGNGTLSDNDFASGDIPLSAENYAALPANSVIHLPIMLGAISFFHSVPTGEVQLNLTPCVLAKIFRREITDWTHSEIKDLNPNLDLSSSLPITVARRVLGSSSTASITAYLQNACPDVWPEELVGSTIEWPEDTEECEGSAAMTECILAKEGTIGYIDSGHGHAEGLQEIDLRNADNVYVNSKEAIANGGVLAAAANAGFPDSLDADFSGVNLLNQPGSNTWPIVAMTYIYVRKDLTFIPNPASQTLLKTFLSQLYSDDFIPICESDFGFVRVTGDLRNSSLAAIDSLVVSSDAPEWIIETDTLSRVGQGDYVISTKRDSYSEVEQNAAVDDIAALTAQIAELQATVLSMQVTMAQLSETTTSHTHSDETGEVEVSSEFLDSEPVDDTQVKTALALASVSFILWMLTIIGLLVKYTLHV